MAAAVARDLLLLLLDTIVESRICCGTALDLSRSAGSRLPRSDRRCLCPRTSPDESVGVGVLMGEILLR